MPANSAGASKLLTVSVYECRRDAEQRRGSMNLKLDGTDFAADTALTVCCSSLTVVSLAAPLFAAGAKCRSEVASVNRVTARNWVVTSRNTAGHPKG